MNNNEYILNQEIKNRRILLKMYRKQEKRIMEQLYNAYLEERSTRYLESLYYDIKSEIDTLDKFFAEYAKRQTKETYINGAKQADYQFRQLEIFAGEQFIGFTFGQVNREAVAVLARETYTPLNKLTKTLGRNCKEYLNRENFKDSTKALAEMGKFFDNELLRKTGLKGVEGIVFGNETWQQGMRKMRDELIEKGALKIPYFDKKGNVVRLVNVQDHCKMLARTTSAHIQREGTKDRIKEVWGDNGDLVEIIGESEFGEKSPCYKYQGMILSLEGNTPQDIIDKCGDKYAGLLDDAIDNGLFHPNCIHSMGVSNYLASIYGLEE